MNQSRPKTIQIFLPDGDPQSIRIAEVTSRTVQAIQVPRGVIDRAASHDELRQVGVYFLFGEADEGELPQVYIGEAQDCWVRIGQHHKDVAKDYWTHAVAVTSKTHRFDKGQVQWLEWYATQKATVAKRYRVENICAAKEPHLTVSVKADLHDHFETLETLVATLGFPLFRTVTTHPESLPPAPAPMAESGGPVSVEVAIPSESEVYGCSWKGCDARGQVTAEGFAVLKGSVVRRDPVGSFAGSSGAKTRARLEGNGVIALVDGEMRFTRDYVFRTPSGAADVVMGRSANGWDAWKNGDGLTLDQLRQQA